VTFAIISHPVGGAGAPTQVEAQPSEVVFVDVMERL